jgi:hypothetical protein
MCARTGSEPTSSALFAERPATLAYDARAVQATMQGRIDAALALTVAFCSTVTCNTSDTAARVWQVHLASAGMPAARGSTHRRPDTSGRLKGAASPNPVAW